MPNENCRKLFIGGLDRDVDESELHQYFARYGDIEKCIVYRDQVTGISRGFGFITYYDSNVIDNVIADKPHGLRTKQVQLKRAVHKHQFEKFEGGVCVNKLYVRGTGYLTASDLQDYFGQFGNILNIDVIKDYRTGLPKGCAFITFTDYDAVDKIVLGDRHLVKNHLLLTRKAKTKNQMRLLMFKKQQQLLLHHYPEPMKSTWCPSSFIYTSMSYRSSFITATPIEQQQQLTQYLYHASQHYIYQVEQYQAQYFHQPFETNTFVQNPYYQVCYN